MSFEQDWYNLVIRKEKAVEAQDWFLVDKLERKMVVMKEDTSVTREWSEQDEVYRNLRQDQGGR